MGLQHDLVGASPPIRKLIRFIERAARTDSTVLIEGESGTGKECVARALHRNGPRAPGPFVAINCAALSEALLESELFGHEKGAFTGAVAARRGRFELASGGTLFLDEIGELAASVQAKLLRALETREIDRLGGGRPIAVDIRLIAATNRNLEKAVANGRFREDLYYRLKVLPVRTPTLAERREDIPSLARYFLGVHASRAGRSDLEFAPEAMEMLVSRTWPGNVRQLQNAIEHAVVLGASTVLGPGDFPEDVRREPEIPALTYQQAIRETKRRLFEAAFAHGNGNYKEAARLLGLHPKAIHRSNRNLDLGYLLKG
jgi:transcriptional regulator with GAF, ATPase, and Fis domain